MVRNTEEIWLSPRARATLDKQEKSRARECAPPRLLFSQTHLDGGERGGGTTLETTFILPLFSPLSPQIIFSGTHRREIVREG